MKNCEAEKILLLKFNLQYSIYPTASLRNVQAAEKLLPSKENIQHFKHEISSLDPSGFGLGSS
jgi:hypothetical protein